MAEKKSPGRPRKVETREIYCVCSRLRTSKGAISHGDRIDLPRDEALRLINEGKAQ